MDTLTVGTKVTNGTYTGKVRKVLDRFTVTVSWGPEMDNPTAASTVELSVNLKIVECTDNPANYDNRGAWEKHLNLCAYHDMLDQGWGHEEPYSGE